MEGVSYEYKLKNFLNSCHYHIFCLLIWAAETKNHDAEVFAAMAVCGSSYGIICDFPGAALTGDVAYRGAGCVEWTVCDLYRCDYTDCYGVDSDCVFSEEKAPDAFAVNCVVGRGDNPAEREIGKAICSGNINNFLLQREILNMMFLN